MDELPHPVPVFPLPNVVLFPRVTMPFHVFELRYRTMVREALSGRREIALALLQPGWERDYHASPPFFPLGCLARIEHIEWLPNDCYDLALTGLARVRLGRLAREFPYRAAHASVLPQHPYPEDDPLVEIEKRSLRELSVRLVRRVDPATTTTSAALEALDLETLANRLGALLPVDAGHKLALLALDSVLERARRVRETAERVLGAAESPGAGAREDPGEAPSEGRN